jgi:Cu+-exporting ATPase
LDYAFHFHFFGKLPSAKDNINRRKEEILSQWLLEVTDFSALPGKGIQCWINGKKILVSWRIQLCFYFAPSNNWRMDLIYNE